MEAFAVGPDYDDALTAPVDDTTQTGARCEPPPDPPEPVRARRASAPLDAGAR